jgi:pimeloyl-ACP methyl ester carboxylesterase
MAVVLARFAVQAQETGQKAKVDGIWLGTIKAGAADLRIAFHVSAKDDKLSATLDSLDQGVKGLKVSDITFKDGVLRMEVKLAGAVYEGKLNNEGTEIAGTWMQGGVKVPLTLKRVDKLPSLARPQEPKPPFPYREQEITYENKKAKVKFAGTLTLPKGDGPFPAVLLITGSGPQDRNEEIFGHKPFLLIADYLTRRGIAVLRVDDRGVGGSTGNLDESTSADLAEDVLAGIEFLKARKEIDAKRIGLIGHSEGGLIAPLAASQSKDVAFIVMLAGTAHPGDEILIEQNKLIMAAAGASKAAIARQVKFLSLALPIIKQEEDPKKIEQRVFAEFAAWKAKADEDEKKAVEQMEAGVKKGLKGLTTKWFRFFLSYDPVPALRKVTCPVLALNGEKDLQVPCKMNLETIAKTLKESGHKDFTVKEFPNLNHLFQTCKTGGVNEYASIEETMAPVVLETMAEWILARMK